MNSFFNFGVWLALIVFGGWLLSVGITNGNKNREVENIRFESVVELTNVQIAQEGKICNDSGMDIRLNYDVNTYMHERKVVGVSCVPKRPQVVEKEGIGLGTVVGGVILGNMLFGK